MAEARATKWRTMKKSFVRLSPDEDSLRQHCLHAPEVSSSPLGHGWDLADGCCHPVHHTQPALPAHLPAPRPAEDSGSEDEEEGDDGA